jgi:hypothetical protein
MLGRRVLLKKLLKIYPVPGNGRSYPPSACLRACERLELVS